MPSMTAADATLVLDHVLGDPRVTTAVAKALLAALPAPSNPTPRLQRGVLLRRLADDPVSQKSLKTIHLLASLPASASPSPIAATHIAVAAFLAASAPDFDAAASALFARPNGTARKALQGFPDLASDDASATMDQFEAAIGNSSSQTILRRMWGDRTAAEERVREFLAAEWAAIEPSKLEVWAEQIVGDRAVDTWRAAHEANRANLRILAGEVKTREVLSKLEEPTSSANPNPISTPAFEKRIDALKTSCADLHSVVEDPLPAAKAIADELLDARRAKGVRFNAEQVRDQPTTCHAAGPSALNDKDKGPTRGKPHNLMDQNPTAQTSQWEDSADLEGSESSLRRPQLHGPRRLPGAPLPPPANKSNRRTARKWNDLEKEALRKGVQKYGEGNWKVILANYPDVLFGRTPVDLKDKWRNLSFGRR